MLSKNKEDSTSFNKKARFGPSNPMWKGGRHITSSGYVRILKPEHPRAGVYGYVYEHSLVWEEANKACLLPWSNVDHINKIKTDNRPENLRAMMNGHHTRRHHVGLKCSEETKRKIRDAQIGIPRKRGWHHTPETIEKMRQSYRDRHP